MSDVKTTTLDFAYQQIDIRKLAPRVYRWQDTSHVVFTGQDLVRTVQLLNAGGSSIWLFVLDAAAVPSDTTTWVNCNPLSVPIRLPASAVSPAKLELFRPVSRGLVLAPSSTYLTFTAASVAIQTVVEYGR